MDENDEDFDPEETIDEDIEDLEDFDPEDELDFAYEEAELTDENGEEEDDEELTKRKTKRTTGKSISLPIAQPGRSLKAGDFLPRKGEENIEDRANPLPGSSTVNTTVITWMKARAIMTRIEIGMPMHKGRR